MYKISDEVINFIEKTMETWRVELIAGETTKEVYFNEMHYHRYYS